MAEVGQVIAKYDQNQHGSTKIYALDLNHLLIRNFRNSLELLDKNGNGEAKGYFIVGYQPLSTNLRANDSAVVSNVLMDEKTRKNLFIEAEQKGKYVRYPNYADINDPVRPFSSPMDIILE